MRLSTTDLRTDRHWRSATGLDQKRFDKLLALLPAAYQQIYGQSIQQRQEQCPEEPALNTYEDLLLFTLFSLKSGLSFDLLGFTTGLDGSTAKRNQDLGLLVIKAALSQSGHMPKRHFDTAESFKAYFKDKGSVLIDATEQRTQRPGDATAQKQMYSGKKKAHTVKTLILSTRDRYIHFVSKGWVGKWHDYKQLKHEFSPDQSWFSDLAVSLDLGYQGFSKDYDCQSVSQPTKKPKNAELSVGEKAANQQINSGRISVEHAIGGLKRYRYLSDRLRTHKVNLYESALLVCAGVWNFYLTN